MGKIRTRITSRDGLVAETRVPSLAPSFYLRVFLWTPEAFEREVDTSSRARCDSMPWVHNRGADTRHTLSPCLARLHFKTQRWDDETIAHEVQHAILHRITVLGPHWQRIEDLCDEERQQGDTAGTLVSQANEDICTEAGRWFAAVQAFLWKHDPNPKWQRSAPAEPATST